MRYEDHITIDGKIYYTGTVFTVPGYWAGYKHNNFEVTFVAYDTERNMVCYEDNGMGGAGPHRDGRSPLEQFQKRIISVKEEKNTRVRCPVKKKRPDSEIDGLTTAWIWYIVLMAVFTIFKDNVGIWCLLSFYFFSWRHKKIEKEGYYYEWNP